MPTKKIEETEEVTRCPECNSGHLSFDYERGELICEECGLVLTDQMIDQGPEWRAFDVEQGEKRPHRRADDVHDPRQRPLDDDRLEEQGLVRQIDPDAEPRAAVSPPEMATADPREQRDGTQPRVRSERARPDGERHGPAAERPRDGRDGVPQGREQELDPRAVDRGRRGRVPVRSMPTVQRAEDPR